MIPAKTQRSIDTDAINAGLAALAPGKRHQVASDFLRVYEKVKAARASGVPWTSITEELGKGGLTLSVPQLKKMIAAEDARRESAARVTAAGCDPNKSDSSAIGTEAMGGGQQ